MLEFSTLMVEESPSLTKSFPKEGTAVISVGLMGLMNWRFPEYVVSLRREIVLATLYEEAGMEGVGMLPRDLSSGCSRAGDREFKEVS